MNNFDPVHNELVSAGRDLDRNISGNIPPFKPRSDMPARLAVVGATLAIFGVGAFGFSRIYNGGEEINTDFASEQVEPDFGDSAGTPEDAGTGEDPLVVDGDITTGGEGSDGDPNDIVTDEDEGDDDATTGSDSSSEGEIEDTGPVTVAITDTGDLVADKIYRTQTSLDRPTTTEAVNDEQFGLSVQAVTTAEQGAAIVAPANASPTWSSDGSHLILYRTGQSPVGHLLLDGNTYQPIGMLPIKPLDVLEIYWDPTDGNRFYYVDSDTFELISFDVSTNVGRPVHQFECDDMSGFGFKRLSADGRIFAHNCLVGSQYSYVVYDLEAGTETRAPAESKDAPQPTPTSGLFVVNGGGQGTTVLDSSLKKIRSLPLAEYADSAIIETPDGRDLLVSSAYSSDTGDVGNVITVDLASGSTEVVVGTKSGYVYPPSNTAIATSAANSLTVIVSIGGTGLASGLLDGELLMVEFGSGSPVVYRLGHHRSANSVDGLDDYWSRPGVALAPDSQRVLYSSDWGGDRVDSFVIDFGGTNE